MNQRGGSILVAAFAALLLLAACGKSDPPATTPSGARASCAIDTDCVVTSFGGCCACCESKPHAIPAIALAQQRASCAHKDCERTCDPNIECAKVEPTEAFTARCKEGTCTAVHR